MYKSVVIDLVGALSSARVTYGANLHVVCHVLSVVYTWPPKNDPHVISPAPTIPTTTQLLPFCVVDVVVELINVIVVVGSCLHPSWMYVQNLLLAYVKTSRTQAYQNNGRLDNLNGDLKKGSFAVVLTAFAVGATIAAVLSNPNTRNRISEQSKKLLKRVE